MNVRRALLGVLVLVPAYGCGGGKKNKAPDPVIESPHEGSSHLPTNNIDFNGRATDPEDGPLASAAMRWEVRNAQNAVVFASPGSNVNATLPNAGDYTVHLYAADSKGKEGRATTTIKIGNTTAQLLNPDNYGFVGISTPFDIDGRAQTIAPATTITLMTFIGVDRDSNAEVFRLPVAANAGNCNVGLTVCNATVTPSVPAGRYKMMLEVETTVPAETAVDTLYVIADSPPVVAITSPVDASRIAPGTQIAFAGTATDPGGDTLDISWTSSIEGEIGTQLTFNRSDLTTAKHQIRLTATDVNGQSSTATIDLYIEDGAAPLFVTNSTAPVTDVSALGVAADLVWYGANGSIGTLTTAGMVAANSQTTQGNTIVHAISVGANGDVLFGLDGQSVDRVASGTLTKGPNVQNANLDPNVFDIAVDPISGGYYFATDVGISFADQALAGFTEYIDGLLGNNPSNTLDVSSDGTVWVGTDGDGLLKVTGLGGTPSVVAINVDQGLCGDVVWDVAVDAQDKVWIGCDGGLSVHDPVANTVVTYENLPDDRIHAIAFGAAGIVWLGTEQGALRLDTANDRVTVMDGADLPSQWVEDIVIDGSGDKYFGCVATGGGGGQGGGVTRYSGE